MDAIDYLFYGYGQVVFALALADGKVQNEEHDALLNSIQTELDEHGVSYDISAIIFELMKKQQSFSSEDSYSQGIKNMTLGSHKLTPVIRNFMTETLHKLAESYPPVIIQEANLLDRFDSDLKEMR